MNNKKIKLVLSVILVTGLFTGCSKDGAFYFDFTKLLQVEKTIEKEVELSGINLKQSVITKEDVLNINNKIDLIFKTLADKDYYFKNFNNSASYFYGVKSNISDDFYTKVSAGEIKSSLKKSIDNIYYNEYSSFKEANVIAIEKTFDGLNCYVEVVSLSDDLLFNTEVIQLNLDNNFNIIGDKTISDMSSQNNTVKSLGEGSLLQNNHDKFIEKIEELFDELKNPNLYEEIKSVETAVPQAEFALDTMVNNINIKNKNNDSLKQLFFAGKGRFNTYAVDSYKIDDVESMANTSYVLNFSVNGEIESYEVEFSRILNEITKVTKRA